MATGINADHAVAAGNAVQVMLAPVAVKWHARDNLQGQRTAPSGHRAHTGRDDLVVVKAAADAEDAPAGRRVLERQVHAGAVVQPVWRKQRHLRIDGMSGCRFGPGSGDGARQGVYIEGPTWGLNTSLHDG